MKVMNISVLRRSFRFVIINSSARPSGELPVILEAGLVVAVEDVPPAVDVDDAGRNGDEEHQRELHHVTDLNQHCGSHER